MRVPFLRASRESRLAGAVLFLLVLLLGITQGPGGKLEFALSLALVPGALYLVYESLRWYQEDHRSRHQLVGDLTDQLLLNHRELVEKDRVHKTVFDSVAEGLLLIDENGDLQMVNRAARRLFSIPDGDLLNGLWDRGHIALRRDTGERYDAGDRPLDRALRGEGIDIEIFRVRTREYPGGRWLSCSAHPIMLENSHRRGAIMVARDITGLMEAQDRLTQSEQRLRGLMEKLPAVVWTTDNELVLQSSQGSALGALGLEPDELAGRSMFEVFRTEDPDFKPIAQQRLALDGKSTSYEFFWRERNYAVTVEPLRDPQGSITGSIGIALDITEDTLIQRQIDAARQIQMKLFPSSAPTMAGCEIGGATFPAEIAAGDYFDYLDMEDGSIGLVVGDVSGHGIGPALLMADTRAYLRVLAHEENRLETILERANRLLYQDTEPDRFVTLFMGKLEPARRRLRYASAGHSTGYILDKNGRVREQLLSTTTPLGLFPRLDQSVSRVLQLDPGDLLVVLTDGVTDASPDLEAAEFFGDERALELIHRHRGESPQVIVERLHREVHEFLGNRPQNDDVTAVVLKVTE